MSKFELGAVTAALDGSNDIHLQAHWLSFGVIDDNSANPSTITWHFIWQRQHLGHTVVVVLTYCNTFDRFSFERLNLKL